MEESLFSTATLEFWRTLADLPLAASLPSRKPGVFVRGQGVNWRRSAGEWAKIGRIGTRYVGQARYRKPGRLIVLWDVSGSMSSYIDLYLPWLWRLVQLSPEVGVFPFATRIDDITQILRKPFRVAQAELAQLQQLWVGGTSIGAMFTKFNEQHAATWIRGRTTVMVISDGWDVGSPDEIAHNLRAWQRREARIFWINPLAATPGFEPRTRALQAALPFIERMLSGHSPQVLQQLYLH